MKAPRWLTESFRDGVDEREAVAYIDEGEGQCWLAQFDRGQRPCEGRFERFHFINRQRVHNALFALLPNITPFVAHPGVDAEILQAAEWDSRNGGIGCEFHHRHFDKHLVSVPSEQVVVPYSALPEHVLDFVTDWGLEDELEARFPAPSSTKQTTEEAASAAPEGADR